MPYFKWVGVTIAGDFVRGKMVAASMNDLDERLLLRGVALIRCKKIWIVKIAWPISDDIRSEIFRHIAQLLAAGVLLPEALRIVSLQSYNPFICDMIAEVRNDIMQGTSLSHAFKKQHDLCNAMTVTLLHVGDQSSYLAQAFEHIADYYDARYSLKKSIYSALAMPALTLIFFIGISVFIFTIIIPRFADLFFSFHEQLPPITRAMIACSEFMRSRYVVFVFGFIVVLFTGVYYYLMCYARKCIDIIKVRIIIIGPLIHQYLLGQSFYALSLLIVGGVTLPDALHVLIASMDNCIVKKEWERLYHDVMSGYLLSDAMERSRLFSQEVVSLVALGQESDTLSQALQRAACVYLESVRRSLSRFVFLLQPLAIMILGLLVAILIFSVYLPIMNLSYVM